MNKIRHACFMIGEDLGIGGVKAIKDFPEGNPIEQILFMQKLLERLEQKSKTLFKERKDYIDRLISPTSLKLDKEKK